MLRIFTLLFLMIIAPTTAQGVTGDMIKDIVFKKEQELTAKYGKPIKTAKPADETWIFDDYSLEWVINKQRILVSYEDSSFKKVKAITLYNYNFNKDTFYKNFGWDEPKLEEGKGFKGVGISISGLNGFHAFYDTKTKYFTIRLKNPNIKTFGKKI